MCFFRNELVPRRNTMMIKKLIMDLYLKVFREILIPLSYRPRRFSWAISVHFVNDFLRLFPILYCVDIRNSRWLQGLKELESFKARFWFHFQWGSRYLNTLSNLKIIKIPLPSCTTQHGKLILWLTKMPLRWFFKWAADGTETWFF